MIKHIVFFSAKNPSDKDAIFDGLRLLEHRDANGFITIYRNNKIDQLNNDVDFIVYGEFKDEHALKAYKANPAYQQSIDRVRPLRDMRIAADFTVPVQLD